MIKERDGWKARCLEATEERDMWKNRCQEVATGIVPVLDLIDPALTEEEPRTRQLGWSRDVDKRGDGSRSS